MLDAEFEVDLPPWAKKLAVFDLETTGLELSTARVVTACVAVIDSNGQVEKLTEWLVNPGIGIPAVATSVHGITTEKAISDGRAANEAISEIIEELNLLNQSMPLVTFQDTLPAGR